jgi:hypothetical protein
MYGMMFPMYYNLHISFFDINLESSDDGPLYHELVSLLN